MSSKGYKHTEEWKRQARLRMLGKKNNLGKKFPKEFYPNHGGRNKIPWNKGLKGYIGSNVTSFKKGQIPWNYLNGKSKKYPRKMKYHAHHNWCNDKLNLSYIPNGFCIHHIDLNPCNNDTSNLFLMNLKDHLCYHNNLIKKYKEELSNENRFSGTPFSR